MADIPSFAELARVARDEALTRNSRLTREVLEREGSDANAVVSAGVAAADEVIGQLLRAQAGTFLDSARRKDLDRLVFDRYGLTRKPASPAQGSVQFSTATATVAAFPIPVDTRLQTADGKTFLTTTNGAFPSGSTGPVVVAVRSADAGANQQARIGTITSILDTIPGAPTDLVVTNVLATTGADDEELDDSLRDRARRFFTTVRRGTLRSIEAAGLAVPGVRTAVAFEFTDEFGRPNRATQLIISDAFTEALVDISVVPVAYQAQSQVLAATVFQALDDVRAAGIFVDVVVAQVSLLGVRLGLSFQAGVDVDSVALQARAAVVSYINALQPAQAFDPTEAINRLRLVAGLIVTGSEIISPVGTVTPSTLEVLRTTLGLVVASSVQPDQALQGSAVADRP